MGLKYQNAYGCLRWGWVGGSEVSKCSRVLALVVGGGFSLTLTQNKTNIYNLDTERSKIWSKDGTQITIFEKHFVIIILMYNCILKRQHQCNFYLVVNDQNAYGCLRWSGWVVL